jgi:hypothetical protein
LGKSIPAGEEGAGYGADKIGLDGSWSRLVAHTEMSVAFQRRDIYLGKFYIKHGTGFTLVYVFYNACTYNFVSYVL